MKKLLKALLAGLMMIGNTDLVLAEETPSDSDEKVLDLYDLDPSTLNVSKLGELGEEPEPEEEIAQFKLSDIVRVSIELDGESTIDAGYAIKNIAQNDGAVNYRAQLKAQQDAVVAEINSMLADPIEVKWNLTLAMNAISAYVKYGDIAKIKTVDGWKTRLRHLWEQTYGDIPNGYVVISVDGNKLTNDPDQLRIISNKTLTILISNDWNNKGSVIVDTGIMWCKLCDALEKTAE